MDRFNVGGAGLEYLARGSGEPLLLVHGAIVADSFDPMLEESDLTDHYRVITYHRRGFAGSAAAPPDRTPSNECGDAVALLDHLGAAKAHVVGHSYGGAVALQLALEVPDRVHSLALFEPPLLGVPSAESFFAGVAGVSEKFLAGDHPAALLAFLELVGGPDPMSRLGALPESAYAQALSDLPTLFNGDLPAIGGWQFDQAAAARITQPALAVLGTESAPVFRESIDAVRQWLPSTELFMLDGATHFLQMERPAAMGAGLAAFLQRHPMELTVP
jgi:pimeloyl-ACP methyl ester carboxylesterase